ncbi:hypothetical protein ABZ652_31185 [Micromonospora chalcea]|uniref:hypothetical protein n=1 Tax=Micromonospora chalcea TaxID=1874 RepID=UPI003401F40C
MTDFDELIGAEDGYLAEGVAVTHDGHPIGGISRTCFALWNHKGDVVSRTDVLPTDPLRIVLSSGDRAFQVRLLTRSREQNGVSVRVASGDGATAPISFDFLDAGDGAVLEIIHQGTTPARLVGTIRGATIVDKGSANLSLAALARLSKKNRLRRLIDYHFTDARSSLRFALAIGGTLGLLLGFFLRFSVYNPFRRGRFVDPNKYDLTNLDGQADFARKVTEVGKLDLFTAMGLGATVLAVLAVVVLAVVAVWSPMRQVVPAGILQEWFVIQKEWAGVDEERNSEDVAMGPQG